MEVLANISGRFCLLGILHTSDFFHISHPTSFLISSGFPAFSRSRLFSTSLVIVCSSSFSMSDVISSMIGSELCTATWTSNVVVAVGLVGSGAGREDRVE